jgi:hypothetical protein
MEIIIEEFMNNKVILENIRDKINELSPSGKLEIYYVPSIIQFILEIINVPNEEYNTLIMGIFESLDVIPDEEYDNYLYVTNSIIKLVMYSRNNNKCTNFINKLCCC